MKNQSTTIKKENPFTKFNINTDCMVSDMYEKYDTPNGAVVYGIKLDETELIDHTGNSRYGFVIMLDDNNFLFRDIIGITPTRIVTQNRKDIQQEVLQRNQIKSYYKIETSEYY